MPAHVIADNDVHDREAYTVYAQKVPATLGPYGGRLLVAGGELTVDDGGVPRGVGPGARAVFVEGLPS